MSKFSFGTDPEFMLAKDGKIVSAIGVIPGTKERRKLVGNYAFYYDNVLGECCVPPSTTKEQAVENMRGCLQAFATLVAPHKILAQASHTYDKDQLLDKEALIIGCSRESCCYTMQEITPDESMFLKTNLRSAGGHIHLGSKVLLQGYNTLMAIRLLDLFLGVPTLFLDNDPTSKKRKELYGKAGRFRQPTYGIEYRSIGNYWLASPNLVELIFDLSKFVVDLVADKEKAASFWKVDEERLSKPETWLDPSFHPSQCHECVGYNVQKLRKVLDKGDRREAAQFMEFITPWLGTDLMDRINHESKQQYDLYKEWNINA